MGLLLLQVGYFVGGVASLESSEIAGIAVSFSFVAILVLLFVVVFIARHRFNNCAKFGDKPIGTAIVEKVSNGRVLMGNKNNKSKANNGSVEMMMTNGGVNVTIERKKPNNHENNVAYATTNLDNNSVTVNGTVYNNDDHHNHHHLHQNGTIQSSTQNILEDTDDDDDDRGGFSNSPRTDNARNAVIVANSSSFNRAFESESPKLRSNSPHIYANHGLMMTRSYEDPRSSGFYSPQLPHRQQHHHQVSTMSPDQHLEWRGSGHLFHHQNHYPSDFGLPKTTTSTTATLPNRAHHQHPHHLFNSPLTDLAEEPETDIVSPLHHSSPKQIVDFQHPHNKRLVSSPATMSRVHQRLFSPPMSSPSSDQHHHQYLVQSPISGASSTDSRTSPMMKSSTTTARSKMMSNNIQRTSSSGSARESPDEGIQDDCSTDV